MDCQRTPNHQIVGYSSAPSKSTKQSDSICVLIIPNKLNLHTWKRKIESYSYLTRTITADMNNRNMDIVTVVVIAQTQAGESLKPSNPNIKRRKEELLSRYSSPHLKSQQRQLDFCEFQARLLYTVSSRDTDVERSCPHQNKNKTKQTTRNPGTFGEMSTSSSSSSSR